MSKAGSASNKAKIARRVIEVLEYFDDDHRHATVMDIVRRYDRPQSSTSELLSCLVELGLLCKDPFARSYSLAPRAALIGAAGQTGAVRDGRIVNLIDRLVAQTGLPVALFGMVGTMTQIVSWRNGTRSQSPSTRGLHGGLQEPLCDNAAGRLLLTTIAPSRRDGVIRRLNAEAPADRKFSATEMSAQVSAAAVRGHFQGNVGFGSEAEVLVVLLPSEASDHPLAIGVVHGREDRVNADELLRSMNEAVEDCIVRTSEQGAALTTLPNAA